MCQLLLWVVLWLGLTAKRRWGFKLPPLAQQFSAGGAIHPGKQKILSGMLAGTVNEPLLPRSPPPAQMDMLPSPMHQHRQQMDGGEDIYWNKLQPNSPKMKVTFNEVTSMSPLPSTSSTDPNQHHQNYALAGGEHGGKR